MAYSSAKDSRSLRSALDSVAEFSDSSRPRTSGTPDQHRSSSSVKPSSADIHTNHKVTSQPTKAYSRGGQKPTQSNPTKRTSPGRVSAPKMAFGIGTSAPTKKASSKPKKTIVPDKPRTADSEQNDPAMPQATPVTGHFNIICLTAKGYNRLIDLLLREANYYDQLGERGKDAVNVMENMVYTFSKSSTRFTGLDGSSEVLLTIMDEDFTNILGILLKSAYSNREDPTVDYSQSLPYAGT